MQPAPPGDGDHRVDELVDIEAGVVVLPLLRRRPQIKPPQTLACPVHFAFRIDSASGRLEGICLSNHRRSSYGARCARAPLALHWYSADNSYHANMGYERSKPEHAGAKNGGGSWMTRAEAKETAKRQRRQEDKGAAGRDRAVDEWGGLDEFSARGSEPPLRQLDKQEAAVGFSWESQRDA